MFPQDRLGGPHLITFQSRWRNRPKRPMQLKKYLLFLKRWKCLHVRKNLLPLWKLAMFKNRDPGFSIKSISPLVSPQKKETLQIIILIIKTYTIKKWGRGYTFLFQNRMGPKTIFWRNQGGLRLYLKSNIYFCFYLHDCVLLFCLMGHWSLAVGLHLWEIYHNSPHQIFFCYFFWLDPT